MICRIKLPSVQSQQNIIEKQEGGEKIELDDKQKFAKINKTKTVTTTMAFTAKLNGSNSKQFPEPNLFKPNENSKQHFTYMIKESYEYFKPKISVEMDNPDKQDSVTEIHIKGWKVEKQLLEVLCICLPYIERLNTIKYRSYCIYSNLFIFIFKVYGIVDLMKKTY